MEVTKADNVVVLGDFNYFHIDSVNMFLNYGIEMRFLDIINNCELESLVTEPSRGIVILDMVLSRAKNLNVDVAPTRSSDHMLLSSVFT